MNTTSLILIVSLIGLLICVLFLAFIVICVTRRFEPNEFARKESIKLNKKDVENS